MHLALVLAMSSAAGTALTIGIIVLLVLVFGVIIFSSDMNWFD